MSDQLEWNIPYAMDYEVAGPDITIAWMLYYGLKRRLSYDILLVLSIGLEITLVLRR